MIPKVIHYCWFGGKPLPDDVQKCIVSWKKKLPDYEIKEWNESNFNFKDNLYAREAYNHKKWAFVADYARIYVLVKYGGIYLDTDVEVIKSMDSLLQYKAFCCFQESKDLCTAVLGCESNFEMFEEWLKLYDELEYNDSQPNVIPFTRLCQKYGLKLNNQQQTIEGLEVFPSDYFSPKNYRTNETILTSNTYTIHHFHETWRSPLEKRMHRRDAKLTRRYGPVFGHVFANIINLPVRIYNAIKKRGIIGEFRYFISKFYK